jgi:hypothetical protein
MLKTLLFKTSPYITLYIIMYNYNNYKAIID